MPPTSTARAGTVAAVLSLAVAGCATPADAPAPPDGRASPAPQTYRPHPADFDGDGHEDLVLALPAVEIDGTPDAGCVVVVPGSADGPDVSSARAVSRADEGVPGSVAEGDRFGGGSWPGPGTLAGDLDGDGLTDLFVGAGHQGGEGSAGQGPVLLWGSGDGLVTGAALDVPYGSVEAIGDFDGDGHPDLVHHDAQAGGGPAEFGLLYGPFSREGGPDRTGSAPIEPGGDDLSLVPGDVNGDGRTDLVGLRSFEETAHSAGVWLGSADGLQRYESDEPLPTADEGTVADVDGDGYGDLVLRDPGGSVENPPHVPGEIAVVYGSPDGPGDRRAALTLDTEGVPGDSFEGDRFGGSLASGDVDGDGYTDVVTGVRRPSGDGPVDAGDVVVLRGGPEGLTGNGAVRYGPEDVGAPVSSHDSQPLALDADGDGLTEVFVRSRPESAQTYPEVLGSLWMFHGDGEPAGILDLTGVPSLPGE
ncbi:FG-GAP and VCBS repeat-containing protein [Nocardiopsis sp. NPDC050513]|uniref:FG-GAP and VCBS repeat-containing protein n=1 Tax=Nocardiopsis sp. NPDC050513 TaxID=3364338 RepID=UPI0037AF44E9